MDIDGKRVLVLGGAGLVGSAVCRALMAERPGRLVLASRQRPRAEAAAEALRAAFPDAPSEIVPVWGDVFIRADWQDESAGAHPRAAVLVDPEKRRRLIADVLDPLDDEIVESSLLTGLIMGEAPGLGGRGAEIVVDSMNTATAVSYQNVYETARRLAAMTEGEAAPAGWREETERLLASLYVPQLVRHVQLLLEAMRRAGTAAYLKVGTSGTGGMGLNIPYTHGEEKPSRLLLSKAALAGAQSLLTFLMARTPGGPQLVKEVKPAAVIGWREIGHGPIRLHGREIALWDCLPERAVAAGDAASLAERGDFGESAGGTLEGVYIDTGENGQFTAAEFTAITALGQMELVTAEEIAETLVRELKGGNTGRDIVAGLDAAVLGPTYRGGFLREAALERLRQLEAEHGEAVAFEILGPPRLSKLLFEAYLLKRACGSLEGVASRAPETLGEALEADLREATAVRRRIISIGLAILLPDGARLLRGPNLAAQNAHGGWVDLTPANMAAWQARARRIREDLGKGLAGDSSSARDRNFTSDRRWRAEDGGFEIGEVVAWILNQEEQGRRGKR